VRDDERVFALTIVAATKSDRKRVLRFREESHQRTTLSTDMLSTRIQMLFKRQKIRCDEHRTNESRC
jgi:hypothetical protein